MKTEVDRNKITLVMEGFYYLFIALTLGILLILSLKFIENFFFQIFVGILIPIGIVLTIYIGIKIISANLNVEKKAQLGLFAIILGFVLILASITKIFLPDLLGSIPFAYWGLGLISLGVIFELTLIDQIIWEALFGIITSISDNFKKSWKFLVKHKKQVFFEFLRFVVTAGGIVLIVLFVKEFLESYFVYVGISFIVIGEIFSRKVVLSAVLNKLLKPPIQFTWDLIKAIGRGLINIWKFFVAHRFIIIKELIRFAGVVAGVYLIYLSYEDDTRFIWYYLVSGIGAIFVSQFLTRMIILKILYDWIKKRILLIIELLSLIADTIKTYVINIYQFINKNWKSILFEFLRAIGAASGILLIVLSLKTTIQDFYLYIGIGIIFVSELLSRKRVYVFIYNKLILYPAENLYAILKNLYTILKQLYNLFIKTLKFLNKHKKGFLYELLRAMGAATGILLIVLSLKTTIQDFYLCIGIAIILVSQLLSRKKVLVFMSNKLILCPAKKLYAFLKQLYNLFIKITAFLNKHKKEFLFELLRLVGVGLGIATVVLAIHYETLGSLSIKNRNI